MNMRRFQIRPTDMQTNTFGRNVFRCQIDRGNIGFHYFLKFLEREMVKEPGMIAG
ncbi:hypothetical protein D3C83_294290 [compost metagenome]